MLCRTSAETMYMLLAICLSVVALCLAPPPPETRKHSSERFQPIESNSYENFDMDNYDPGLDNYGDSIDLNHYEDLYYSEPEPEIEVATLAPKHKKTKLSTTQKPQITTLASIATRPAEPDIFGSLTEQDKLKYVDLSSNYLSKIDDDAFHLLPSLQELILSENQLRHLPELPSSLVRLNVQYNQLQSSGIRSESFKDLAHLQFLHLSHNKLDCVPVPLPAGLRSVHLQNNDIQTMHKNTFCDSRDLTFIRRALEDIRLDSNPINLSKFANDYFCLPRLPTGQYI
ncbi:opticin-like isoform X2 [Anomaloglossus baeobatrachus]|uniref:opticin-like isoform X2 n=1 Tax=Anomaloglossus baeobatrachus TaxID=238106 RepID=UPI003F4FFDF9